MTTLTVAYRSLTSEPDPSRLRDQLSHDLDAPVHLLVLGGQARFTVSATPQRVREAAAFFLDPIGRAWEVE